MISHYSSVEKDSILTTKCTIYTPVTLYLQVPQEQRLDSSDDDGPSRNADNGLSGGRLMSDFDMMMEAGLSTSLFGHGRMPLSNINF